MGHKRAMFLEKNQNLEFLGMKFWINLMIVLTSRQKYHRTIAHPHITVIMLNIYNFLLDFIFFILIKYLIVIHDCKSRKYNPT